MSASRARDRNKKKAPYTPLSDNFTVLILTKSDLHDLADQLLLDDPDVVETCIAFIEADTVGAWHGRARAMMCRRLKHCTLSSQQSDRLVICIAERLRSGNFGQQFLDQLRLALYLDTSSVLRVAAICRSDTRNYVRRYAEWILSHDNYYQLKQPFRRDFP